MAFTDDLTLKNAAAADVIFARTVSDGTSSTWIDTTSTAQEPRTVQIAHRRESIKDKPGESQDRHTVTLKQSKKDTTTGKLYTHVVSMSIQSPLTGPLTRAQLNDLLAFLVNATTGLGANTTSVDRLLRGEC